MNDITFAIIKPDAVKNNFTGKVCDMDRIGEIAQKHNLLIVEDAAQAYGGTFKSQKAGSFSTAAGMSMNSMKVLAGYGEAGAVTTNDIEICEKVRMYRYAGTKSDPKKIITNNEKIVMKKLKGDD